MTAAHTIAVARDCLAEGRYDVAFALFAELVDCRYVRCRSRVTLPRMHWDDDDDEPYEGDDDDAVERTPRTHAEQRQALKRQWRAIDWTAWYKPSTASTSYAAMIREHYSADRVAEMAMRPNSMLALVRREISKDNVIQRVAEEHGIRVRSWPTVVRAPWGGIVPVGDE